jgi:hypothetical protein
MITEACRLIKLDIITYIVERYTQKSLIEELIIVCNENMDISVVYLLLKYTSNPGVVLEYACRNNHDTLISQLIQTEGPECIRNNTLFRYNSKTRDNHIKDLIKSTKAHCDNLLNKYWSENDVRMLYIHKLNDYLYYHRRQTNYYNLEITSILIKEGADNLHILKINNIVDLQCYLSTGLGVTHLTKDYPALCNQWIQFKKSTKKRLYQKLKRILIADVLEIILLYIV